MPLADYYCPGCPGIEKHDHYFESRVGAIAGAPICEVCACFMEWIPFASFDVKTDGDGGKGFQKFDVYRQVPTPDGLVQERVTVDSLHKVRQIEKDSEQRFVNGEGEPLRFRGYAQNRSNMDVGGFGTEGTIGGRAYDSGRTPTKKLPVTRHGQRKPRVATARRGGYTALKEQ